MLCSLGLYCVYVLRLTPTVVDHPHGGGRGKSKGNRHPTSPWGTPVSIHNLRMIIMPRVLTPSFSPKVVTRPADTTTPTNGLSFPGCGTWASEETRRARRTKVRPRPAALHLSAISTRADRCPLKPAGRSLCIEENCTISKKGSLVLARLYV